MRKKILKLCLLLLMMLIPVAANAAIGTVSISATSLNVNASKTLTLNLSDNVVSIDGTITSSDTTCVQVVSVTSSLMGTNTQGKFAAYDSGFGLTAPTVTIKGLKGCTATLTMTYNLGAETAQGLKEERGLTLTSGTITVNEPTPKSNDNSLSDLSVSTGTLTPTFNADNLEYTVEVPYETDKITISATKNHNKASVSGTGEKTLSVGSNQYTITVTAEDGSKRYYKVNVTRTQEEVKPAEVTKSDDATLKSLEVAGQTINPAFDANNLNYTLIVDNNVENLDVNAIANDSKATVAISGNKGLKVGVNAITITVTAEDGTVKNYIINVTRKDVSNTTTKAVKSSNNYLSNLLLANGELNPKFNKYELTYNIKVPKNVDKLDLKAYAEDSKSKVEILNNEELKIGNNSVLIKVTAEDGSVRIYTLNVTKYDLEAHVDLKDLQVNGASYIPSFSKDITYYESTVKGRVKQISINAIPESENAKIEYYLDGKLLPNGIVNLEEGYNLVTVKVSDENGFTKNYYLNVYRKAYTYNIFGIKIPKWLFWLLLFLFLLLIVLLFILLYRRRRKEVHYDGDGDLDITTNLPKIEIKPEFNFSSKNQDNDTAEAGSVLNQGNGDTSSNTQDNDNNGNTSKVNDYEDDEEEVYDPYDEVVTVDELIDAIEEQDPKKLKILYEQEMLNRKKAALRAEEEAAKKTKRSKKKE